ncbi:MAG: hypothetical protein ACTSW1_07495 [Candidatus Hodarchaeales archaeon]
MITFTNIVEVRLDRQHVGNILEVKDGFQYFPRGLTQKRAGKVFPTLQGCKDSL